MLFVFKNLSTKFSLKMTDLTVSSCRCLNPVLFPLSFSLLGSSVAPQRIVFCLLSYL